MGPESWPHGEAMSPATLPPGFQWASPSQVVSALSAGVGEPRRKGASMAPMNILPLPGALVQPSGSGQVGSSSVVYYKRLNTSAPL